MSCQENQSAQARAVEMVVWFSSLRDLVAVYGEEFREVVISQVRVWLDGCGIPKQAVQECDEIVLIRLATVWAGVEFDAELEDTVSLHVRASLESTTVDYHGTQVYLKIETGFIRDKTSKCAMVGQDVILGEA